MKPWTRFWLAAAATPALLGAAAAALSPPPSRLAAEREWLSSKRGYLFRIAYFTKEETEDPRWEEKRLEMMEQAVICDGGKRVTRRDIAWYPPTAESQRLCSAIIYTVQCDKPTHAPFDDFDRDRPYLLSSPPSKPIERDCGEKDRAKRHDPPAARDALEAGYRAKGETLLDPDAACDMPPGIRGRRVYILPETRFSAEIRVHPVLIERRLLSTERIGWWVGREGGDIEAALYQARRPRPVIVKSADLPDNGVNVRLVKTYALDRAGTGYCVEYALRQGSRRWRITIERHTIPPTPPGAATDFTGHSRHPESYWTPNTDAADARDAMVRALGLDPPPNPH